MNYLLKPATHLEKKHWNAQAILQINCLGWEQCKVLPGELIDHLIPWAAYIGLPVWIKKMLDLLGDVEGKLVLDLGTGTGFLATLLALRGAKAVDGVDIAENQILTARMRARLNHVEDVVAFHVGCCENLEFPDGFFDLVVGSFVLHHLDLTRVVQEIHRVLKPSGRCVFLETSNRNRVLMLFRNRIVGRFGIEKARSGGEHPLTRDERLLFFMQFRGKFNCHFSDVFFFRLLPGYIRSLRLKPILSLCKRLDLALYKIPSLRSASYFEILEMRKI